MQTVLTYLSYRLRASDEPFRLIGTAMDTHDSGFDGTHRGGSGNKAACLANNIQAFIGRSLSTHARVVATRPSLSMFVSACLVVVSLAGLPFLHFETSDTLFFPTETYTAVATERLRAEFLEDRILQLYAVADSSSGEPGMFYPGSFTKLGRELDQIVNLRTGDGLGWEDVCDRVERENCTIQSPFHYLRDLIDAVGRDFDVPGGLNFDIPAGLGEIEGLANATESFCRRVPNVCYRMFEKVNGQLIAGVSRDSNDGVTAASVRIFLSLDSINTKKSAAYEAAVHEYVLGPDFTKARSQREHYKFFDLSPSVLDKESSRPASSEGHLMGISFFLVLVFLCCAIAAPSGPPSRVVLGVACLGVICLSLACALGLSGYAGVPMTAMTILMCFTLIGVAVDDIIVIVHTYDRLPGEPNPENVAARVAESLQTSGSAITLTTVTTFVGLVSASFVDMPIVSFFCKSTAFGIFAVYMLQLTLFVPLFIICEKRRCSGERSSCMCLPVAVEHNKKLGDDEDVVEAEPPTRRNLAYQVVTAPAVGGGCGIMQKLAVLLSTSRVIQTSILIAFLAATVFGAHFSTQISTESDLTSYFIDESFIHEYFDTNRELYSSQTPYYLVLDNPQGGVMETDDRRAKIDLFLERLEATGFAWPYNNWLTAFDKYLLHNRSAGARTTVAEERAAYQSDPAAYAARVQEFLNAPAFIFNETEFVRPWSFKTNIVFENGLLKRSRIVMLYEADFSNQTRYIENFHTEHALLFPTGSQCEHYQRGVFCNCFIPGSYAVAPAIQRGAQREKVMKSLVFGNLAFSCLAVTAVVMLVLDPFVGLFVGVIVLAIDALVLAALGIMGSKLDMVAFLCLCMTIGLTVDYSTHTVHAYMHAKGKPDQRLYQTITSMGVSIVSGGGSTLLGIAVLGFASSEAFRSFFKVLGTAIFLGTLVGVLVSPLLMRVIHGCIRVLMSLTRRARAPSDRPT
eukprot:TRINITY_DN4595_c0_g1_i2.p1 TRINITY_DN4595_c0_g1~~TRINITY_DN4595_c0_g1_i2.p1  ORF type:complete len:967 (+),score=89.44 TRINITY_DN4595_c0_g1_i2:293-3193(+)